LAFSARNTLQLLVYARDIMEAVRESWTDDRMDDLVKRVDEGFARVDRRFEQLDRKFEQVDRRFEQVASREEMNQQFQAVNARLDRIDDRFYAFYRLMIVALVTLAAALIATAAS
jgi:hypothetical protein